MLKSFYKCCSFLILCKCDDLRGNLFNELERGLECISPIDCSFSTNIANFSSVNLNTSFEICNKEYETNFDA